MSRVVVVLPLVPVTRTTCRPAASSDSRSGSSRRLMTPPMTEPSPLPASLDTVAAAPPTVVASRARIGSRGRPESVVSIASDAIRGACPGGANPACSAGFDDHPEAVGLEDNDRQADRLAGLGVIEPDGHRDRRLAGDEPQAAGHRRL